MVSKGDIRGHDFQAVERCGWSDAKSHSIFTQSRDGKFGRSRLAAPTFRQVRGHAVRFRFAQVIEHQRVEVERPAWLGVEPIGIKPRPLLVGAKVRILLRQRKCPSFGCKRWRLRKQ